MHNLNLNKVFHYECNLFHTSSMAFVNSNSLCCTSAFSSANTLAIFINYILIPILDASSKQIYRSFLAKKKTTPTAKDWEKLSAKYHHLTIDWKRVYLLSFRTTLETKLREFQFKILNLIVFTNEKLFRFDMAESDKCAFCQTEVESIEHLHFSCKISSVFWKHNCLVLAAREQYYCWEFKSRGYDLR